MSANDTTKVLSGRPNVAGAVTVFDVGATIPGSAREALPTGADAGTPLGYVSIDGITNSYTRNTTNIQEWGGLIVRVLQTDVQDTWTFTLIQSGDADVLAEVFGAGNVISTPGVAGTSGDLITVNRNADPLPPRCFVFDLVDAGKARRIKLGNAQITATGDIAYQNGAAISYSCTVTAFPDADGFSSVEYIEDAVASA